MNTPNITRVEGGYGQDDVWSYGAVVRGEGIYECANRGTCISPDVCTCMDGAAPRGTRDFTMRVRARVRHRCAPA